VGVVVVFELLVGVDGSRVEVDFALEFGVFDYFAEIFFELAVCVV
jgi:hypothetical protein